MVNKIYLANPRGFCAGVERAISIVERALEKVGAPLYVRHEVVHNQYVCDRLREQGVIFVEELSEVPNGQTVVFSAHGVSPAVYIEADQRQLKIFDATCPLVTKVHVEVKNLRNNGRKVIMIGHAGHPEVEGTMGQSDQMYLIAESKEVEQLDFEKNTPLAYVTQTTLSVDDTEDTILALREKFPNIVGTKKDDICYATQNRQDAVKHLANICDLIIVVGSKNSSNSNRLREVAEKAGVSSYLVNSATDIDQSWLDNKSNIGITAGASAPESLVEQVVELIVKLSNSNREQVCELAGASENINFRLPRELS